MLESGLVDSLGVMEIVEFLEQEFNVSVLDEELKEENFASLKNLTMYISKKTDKAVNGVPI
jgi:acyl carrier protein